MSGVGKSTLTSHAKLELEKHGLSVLTLDGDFIRNSYNTKLGFGSGDVEKNNLNVASICENERHNYDVILVPMISPIDLVRQKAKKLLSPGYYLIYLEATIKSLRNRDSKGLYSKADSGLIKDLIGYSNSNPYEIPTKYDLKVDTSKKATIEKSKNKFTKYVLDKALLTTFF